MPNFNPDYGVTAATYTPDTFYSGVGKFADQLVRSERIENRFSSLFKEDMKTGKDLEVVMYKKATGVDYSATNAPVAPYPSSEVLCFKGQERRTYAVKLDRKDIDEAALNEAGASTAAEQIVGTLYSAAFEEENNYAIAVFKDAKAASKQIIDYTYQYNDTDSEKGARELLKQVKIVAKLIRKGETSVNPHGLKVPAASVKMLVPLSDEVGMDVYARMSAYNESFAAYGVDKIITYTPDEGEEGEIYIFDNEYAQFRKVHADSYRQQEIAGCDNVDAFLHRYVQYVGCPLFSCVRIKRKANPTDNSVETVNAIMYATHPNFDKVQPIVGAPVSSATANPEGGLAVFANLDQSGATVNTKVLNAADEPVNVAATLEAVNPSTTFNAKVINGTGEPVPTKEISGAPEIGN